MVPYVAQLKKYFSYVVHSKFHLHIFISLLNVMVKFFKSLLFLLSIVVTDFLKRVG
jgi:hypothetical protein